METLKIYGILIIFIGACLITPASADAPPNASFIMNMTPGAISYPIQFNDTSTNNATIWNWSFGDGTYSNDQNATYIYNVEGTYTVTLNATNGAGSNLTSENITIITPWGYNRQDVYMDGIYTLKITFVDSATNVIIPVVTVVDSVGNTATTTNGTFYGSYSFQVVGIYPSSSGYYSTSMTYLMDGDRNETIALTKSSTISQQQFYSTKTVRFICQDWDGRPITGMNVSAIGVQTSLGSLDWIPTLFGINLNATPITSTTMQGTTGNDGSITYVMIPTEKYAIHYTKPELGIDEVRYYYPQEAEYVETFWTTVPSYSLKNINFQFYNTQNITNHSMTVGVLYNDTYGSTDNLTFFVKDTNKTLVYETQTVPT